MRNTPGLRAVLSALQIAPSPMAVDEIETLPQVKKIHLDQATIYRIIHRLTQKGLLRTVNFHEGKFRFELASHPHHHHVVCTNCATVEDVEDCLTAETTATIEKATGFRIVSHALEFFGLCVNCQKLTSAKQHGTMDTA